MNIDTTEYLKALEAISTVQAAPGTAQSNPEIAENSGIQDMDGYISTIDSPDGVYPSESYNNIIDQLKAYQQTAITAAAKAEENSESKDFQSSPDNKNSQESEASASSKAGESQQSEGSKGISL